VAAAAAAAAEAEGSANAPFDPDAAYAAAMAKYLNARAPPVVDFQGLGRDGGSDSAVAARGQADSGMHGGTGEEGVQQQWGGGLMPDIGQGGCWGIDEDEECDGTGVGSKQSRGNDSALAGEARVEETLEEGGKNRVKRTKSLRWSLEPSQSCPPPEEPVTGCPGKEVWLGG
jgi:hypothetical protein